MTMKPADSRTVQAADKLIATDHLGTPDEVLDFVSRS